MANERQVAVLIPYRIKDGKVFVYLQKRSAGAKYLPDHFGFFGGGLEGAETPEEALEREIQEELCFKPEGYVFLMKYKSLHVYALEVKDDFEDIVTVMEGDYGKFLSEQGVLREQKIGDNDRTILKEFFALQEKRTA